MEGIFSLLIAGLASVGAALVSLYFSGRLYRRRKIGVENALVLLKKGYPEEWNELRVLNPGWIPELSNVDLERSELSQVNFRRAKLDGARFASAKLDGCDFTEAYLVNASFQNAVLDDAVLDRANLKGADLSGASLVRASLRAADLSGVQLGASAETDQERGQTFPSLTAIESLEQASKLSPAQFEQLVADILSRNGYQVEITMHSHDHGYDVIASRDDKIAGRQKFLVEVKRYSPGKPIGVSVVRALLGAVDREGASGGILVTNTTFSPGARKTAKQGSRLRLIDGAELESLLV